MLMALLINSTNRFCFKFPKFNRLLVRNTIIFPLILSFLATISGCGSSDKASEINTIATTDLALLQSARTTWNSISGQYYTIQSQRFCECAPELSVQMKVNILDNLVLSAVELASDEIISSDIQQKITTVDNLFILIEQAIADEVSIEITYNEEFGYPETAKIDLEKLAIDGGLHITLSNLEIQDSMSALDDVVWTLESFDNIAGPQSVIKNTNISLSIDMENMQLSGIGGCNNYTATFVLDDENHNMTISNVFSTKMWCDEPEDIMQQEQDYFTTLAQIRFFTFDKTMLNMVVGGDAGLHFTAAQNSIENPKTDNASNDLASLQNAREKWNLTPKPYYTIQSQRICFCLPEMSAQMKITVLDNSILSAVDINSGDVISKRIQKEIKSVDDLFTLIEKAITDDISVEVSYNEEYGYPEVTMIDLEQLAVDRGLQINLSNLDIQNSVSAMDDVTWTLESFDNIAGPQPIIKNTLISLSIDLENRLLTGNSGCNSYSADFVLNEENHDLTISNVFSTEMWCDEPKDIIQQEKNYLSILEQIRFFTFNKATLNMLVGADAGFHFVAVD